MEQLESLFRPLIDQLPEEAKPYWGVIPAVVGALVLLLLLALVNRIRRGRKAKPAPNQEHGLRENLADYPPVPGPPGPRRLTLEGLPVRLRLVVMAPVGKDAAIEPADVEDLLEKMLYGMGKVVQHDRPRVRIWPPQLSSQGFAAVFHRLVLRPEPEGKPSRWVVVAGQARIHMRPVLLGLGLWADEPGLFSRRALQPEDWTVKLRLETIEKP